MSETPQPPPRPPASPAPAPQPVHLWRHLWTLAVAFAAWTAVFVWRPAGLWLFIGIAAAVPGGLALALRSAGRVRDGVRQGDFGLGLVAAAVLYGVFYLGRQIVPAYQVAALYALVASAPPRALALLAVVVVAPAEEIFWRGLVLPALAERFPGWLAVLVAAGLYAAAYGAAGNPTLLLAAFVGGLFWGGLYLRLRRLAPVIVCHALWDLAVLVLLPLR